VSVKGAKSVDYFSKVIDRLLAEQAQGAAKN